MVCSICKEKPATVHLTQIVGDKMQKLDLCEDCAKAKGVNDPGGFALADLMLGLGASQEMEQSAGGVEIEVSALRIHAGGFQEIGPAGLPGVLSRPLPKGWKDCSRRCTKARGTWARCRKLAGNARAGRPAQIAAKETGQGHRRGRFRTGRPIARRNQTNHPARDGFDGDVSHGHPQISRSTR